MQVAYIDESGHSRDPKSHFAGMGDQRVSRPAAMRPTVGHAIHSQALQAWPLGT
jgi:hypothetical protein